MEKHTVRVSVIIPVYNGEDFLSRCLDSVVDQTYENWEAIVVDDGSVDKSGEIAERYAEKDSRFRVFHKENGGQFIARMEGVTRSLGEIVMFLDSDDYWTPDCIAKVVRAFSEKDADMVLFLANIVDEEGNVKNCVGRGAETEGFLEKRKVCETLLTSHDLNSMCLKAFKRTLFDTVALSELPDKTIRMGEDKIMLLPLMGEAEKVYYLDDVLYSYCYYANSNSHSYSAEKIAAMVSAEMFAETYRYMLQWKMDIKRIRDGFSVYYLRHVMSCYYRVRKSCEDREDRIRFRAYPWLESLEKGSARFLFRKGLTVIERIKLLSMMICESV